MWYPLFSKFNFYNQQETPKDINQISNESIESKIIRNKKELTSSVCKKLEPVVLVHGGAGNIPEHMIPAKLNCVKKAAIAGFKILKDGGTSVEAVEAAIRVMEDDPTMNAGFGSVLNVEGEVENDACIMDGKTLNAGGIGSVKNIKNPISLAKLVMEKSPHVLICGEGAQKFAEKHEYPLAPNGSLVTLAAKEALEAFKADPENDLTLDSHITNQVICPRIETVGAVAIDKNGEIAVGSSSGGLNGKIVGKYNEPCLIGSGLYADNKMGGVSLTGYGKYMTGMMLALQITKDMEKGRYALKTIKKRLTELEYDHHELGGGVGISKYGDIGVFFNTPKMPWAYQIKNILHYGINPREDIQDYTC